MTEQQERRESTSTSNELSGTVTGQAVQAASIGSVHIRGATGSPQLVPAQLPAAPRLFTGRARELTELSGHEQPLTVLSGGPGVGKTTLALRWIQQTRDDYPDGQLFVELGGSDRPVDPHDVLEWFALSLGAKPKAIPPGLPQRAAQFRSLTEGKRLTVLLDDAVSAAQVRPLIPASPDSRVVVTSHNRLSGLATVGARWLEVGHWDVVDSVALLRALIGNERVDAEFAAAQQLAGHCGGLPLAVAIIGARLAGRPHRSLSREASALQEEQHRLATLSLNDEPSVQTALDLACEALTRDSERIYRLGGQHVGHEFAVEALAAVEQWPVSRAETATAALVEANLLTEKADGRFSYHDLVRLHARARSGSQPHDQPSPDERAFVEWYLARTVAADLTVHPLRSRLGARYDGQRRSDVFADARTALDWLTQEQRNLLAAANACARWGEHELTWQWCEALWGLFLHVRHYGEWITLHGKGIHAAQQCRNPRAEARLRSQLGFAYAKTRRFDEAITENEVALRLAGACGDEQARATALSQLGRAARGTGDLDRALNYFYLARDMQAGLGNDRGAALCGRRIGQVLARLGRVEEAVSELRNAANVMKRLGDHTQHARALTELAITNIHGGHSDAAIEVLHEAMSIMDVLDSPYYRAEILTAMGDASRQLGDLDRAREHYTTAAELYQAAEDPKAEEIQARAEALPA